VCVTRPAMQGGPNGAMITAEIQTELHEPGFEPAVTAVVPSRPFDGASGCKHRESFRITYDEVDAFASALLATVRGAKATGVLAPVVTVTAARGAAS